MLSAIYRYIKNTGYSYNILTVPKCASAREVLNGKAIALHEGGKGKREKRADIVSTEDENPCGTMVFLEAVCPKA